MRLLHSGENAFIVISHTRARNLAALPLSTAETLSANRDAASNCSYSEARPRKTR
jgi:hypothetical protein